MEKSDGIVKIVKSVGIVGIVKSVGIVGMMPAIGTYHQRNEPNDLNDPNPISDKRGPPAAGTRIYQKRNFIAPDKR